MLMRSFQMQDNVAKVGEERNWGSHTISCWVITSQWRAHGGLRLNQGFSESEMGWEGGALGTSLWSHPLTRWGHPHPVWL